MGHSFAARLRLLLAAVVAGGAALGCSEPGANGILLVTLDTTRADHLGAYGRQEARTPTLDRMAREGVLFENAVAPAPITLPSHTSILTGVSPAAHGVRDNGLFALGPDAELVSEAFRRAGWRTAAFVGSIVLHPRFGLDQGFEVYDAPERRPDGPLGFVQERRAAPLVDRVLDWAGTLEPGERFFAWVHFFDPHYPYDAPPVWQLPGMHPYDQEIAYTDFQLGRLLAGLEERGHGDRLLVVVTADHGESAGEHGEDSHGVFLYQSTLRVPLIVWGPALGGAAGQRVKGLVSLLDIPATLLAFAGIPTEALPRAAARPLLLPHASVKPADPGQPIYVESLLPYYSFGWRGLRGVIEDGYKLVDGGEPELYALSEDPHESNDLAAQQPERVARLRARLDELGSPGVELGWGASRAMGLDEIEQLRALGYLSEVRGEEPFASGLADPRQRIEDLELVTSVNRLLVEASTHAPLEPGGFARRPDGGEVPGRAEVRKAKRSLLRLRKREPRDVFAQVELAKVESLLGLQDRALPLLEEAVRLRPEDAVLHYHMAHACEAAGRREAALLAMRTALALDPANPRYESWIRERSARPEGG